MTVLLFFLLSLPYEKSIYAQKNIMPIGNRVMMEKLLQWENEAPDTVKKEIKILRTKGIIAKGYAIENLEMLKDKGAILALLEVLDNDTPIILTRTYNGSRGAGERTSIGQLAGKALYYIGEPAKEFLIEVLKGSNEIALQNAIVILADLNCSSAIPHFCRLLSDRRVSMFAASALGKMKAKEGTKPLLNLLKNKDNHDFFEALGEIGDTSAVLTLLVYLDDKDEYNRMESAKALGRIGDVRAIKSLIPLLYDKDYYVAGEAATALGNIGALESVEPLIKLINRISLADTYSANQNLIKILSSLSKIKDSTAVWEVFKWAQIYNSKYSYRSKELEGVIFDMKNRAAFGPLVKAIKEGDKYLKNLAARYIIMTSYSNDYGVYNGVLLEALIPLLSEDDEMHVVNTIKAISVLENAESAVDPIITRMKDASETIRSNAASALKTIIRDNTPSDYEYASWEKWRKNRLNSPSMTIFISILIIVAFFSLLVIIKKKKRKEIIH